MASLAPAPEDLVLEAAEIAAAMLRFQEPLAHLMSTSTPEGQPVVGVDSYAFYPSPRRVMRDQVATHLAALPSPAFLAPTTARGMVTVILLEELTGERRAVLQRELDNQITGVSELAPGSDTDRVLLEFDDESHLFSLAAVRLWARRYGILVGWNIGPCNEPARAEWRMNLIGGDGKRYSKGLGWPPRDR
jgi:hypothetical protein